MSHDRGYVTEKLPQAHLAGAVPLYWGDGVVDSEVWNMRRVLLFDNSTSNAALLDTMLRLEHDVSFRRSWFEELVLASGADAWLAAFMLQLAGHFRRALAAKGRHVHLPHPRAPPAFGLILYINLDSRADKRTAVEAELAAVGWPGRRIAAIHKAPGELGCALSHIAALQLLLDQPSARHALVLEDDFVFMRDPRADVARFLDRFGADDWDVLMLSSNTQLEQPHGDADYITRILEAQTTSGYAVTRAFAPALLASFNRSAELLADARLRHADGAVQTEHCIDQQWKVLQPLARWFCLAPRAGAQRPGLSDITGLVVDHGGV